MHAEKLCEHKLSFVVGVKSTKLCSAKNWRDTIIHWYRCVRNWSHIVAHSEYVSYCSINISEYRRIFSSSFYLGIIKQEMLNDSYRSVQPHDIN